MDSVAVQHSITAIIQFFADGEPNDWRCDPDAMPRDARLAVNEFVGPDEYLNTLTGFGKRCLLGLVAAERTYGVRADSTASSDDAQTRNHGAKQ